MKNINKILHSKVVQAVAFAGIGLFIGWAIFGSSHKEVAEEHVHTEKGEDTIYTCAMHPQIRSHEPGLCPLCGMDLTPLKASGSGGSDIPDGAMPMSMEAIALANIQTTVVNRIDPTKEIMLYGTIQPDERGLQSQTAHVGGRIEKLFVDFTGETVRKGQKLATIYSPELYTAQQELLEALRLQASQPMLVQGAREKLRLWKLSDAQIATIEQTGKVSPFVDIMANTSGVVMAKNVSEGDYIQQGGVLFDVANLTKVWAMFDAYETDLAFLRKGDKVAFSTPAIPGKTFTGAIAFIDPILNKTTRTAKVRVEIANPKLELKPEMYTTANVKAKLTNYQNQIVIPQSAVLWTGKRSIVYISLSGYDTPVFTLREVELGPSLGNSYVVISGLHDGETIVSNGAFAIDASAQLEGKRSMMNETSTRAVTGHEGHNMGNADNHSEHNTHTDHPMNTEATSGAHAGHEGHNMDNAAHSGHKMEHAMLKVSGNCDMCKSKIEKAALGVKGVSSAVWDKETKVLHLNFNANETSVAAISKAIAKVGYDTEFDKADQAVYDELPGCCKYRE